MTVHHFQRVPNVKLYLTESTKAMGGQELAVLLHAEGLMKRGHQLRLVLEPESPIFHAASAKGLPVVPLRMSQAHYPSAILALRRMLRRESPDVLHMNSSRDTWIGTIAARLVHPRPGLVRTRHISTPLNKSVTTRLLYRRLVDRVVVTGVEMTRRALIERDGLEPDRVDAFPIGIDITHFTPGAPQADLREELGLDKDHRLVGMISYLRSYKGHEYLIEAAARVLSRMNKVTFVLVGEGPEEAHIRSRIDALGLRHGVRILGFRPDLLNVFRSLDAFVIPSVEGDTIPQVILQAFAMGLPVVSTTIGSIPDVVREGDTGFVVPPRNAEALADRIETLLADPGLGRQMGARGRRMVEEEFSLERMLDRLEEVYRKVRRR